jgi:hypothetical protein
MLPAAPLPPIGIAPKHHYLKLHVESVLDDGSSMMRLDWSKISFFNDAITLFIRHVTAMRMFPSANLSMDYPRDMNLHLGYVFVKMFAAPLLRVPFT